MINNTKNYTLLIYFILIFSGAFVALIFVELGLRLIPNSLGYVDNGLIRIPWFSASHDFDEAIGFWPKPNQIFRKLSNCYDIQDVDFNSLGMRSQWEPNTSRAEIRIAVLGDSMVQGLQVSNTEHFSALLQKAIPNSEVLNFGVSSTGTTQQLLTYRKKVIPLHPDIVIIAFFAGNDLLDNHPVLERCYTKRNVEAERPFMSTVGQISYPQRRVQQQYKLEREDIFGATHNFFSGHFFTYNLIAKVVSPKLFQHTLEVNETAGERCPSWPYKDSLMPYGAMTPPADRYWRDAWTVSLRAMRMLHDEVVGQGSKFLLVIIPDVQVNVSQYQKEYDQNKLLVSEHRAFSIAFPVMQIVDFATSNDIPAISLLDSFSEYQDKHKLPEIPGFSFSCDGHWNPLGHFVATLAVANKLLVNRMVENTYSASILTAFDTAFEKSPVEILGEKAFSSIYHGGIYHGDSATVLNIEKALQR